MAALFFLKGQSYLSYGTQCLPTNGFLYPILQDAKHFKLSGTTVILDTEHQPRASLQENTMLAYASGGAEKQGDLF